MFCLSSKGPLYELFLEWIYKGINEITDYSFWKGIISGLICQIRYLFMIQELFFFNKNLRIVMLKSPQYIWKSNNDPIKNVTIKESDTNATILLFFPVWIKT